MLKKALITVGLFSVVSCDLNNNGVSLNDMMRVQVRYDPSDQCVCPNSNLATMVSGYDVAYSFDYQVAQTGAGIPTTIDKFQDVSIARREELPVGCTIGNRIDPTVTTNPSPEELQCTKRASYVVTDVAPIYLSGSRLVSDFSRLSSFRSGNDINSLAHCVQACSEGDISSCLPIGTGFGAISSTISDLYDNSIGAGYTDVPSETAMSALQLNASDIPVECQRGETLLLAGGRVINEALIPRSDDWACELSSQSAAFRRNIFTPEARVPAFSILIPNRYDAQVSDPVFITTGSEGAERTTNSRVVTMDDLNFSPIISFSSEISRTPNSSNDPLYGGSIRSMVGVDDIIVMETNNGCVSILR